MVSGRTRAALFAAAAVVSCSSRVPDDASSDPTLAAALNAQGEALFTAAEQKQRVADAIVHPVYAGEGSREDVLVFLNTTVAAWATRKHAAVEDARLAYTEILHIEPAPPPTWVIRAGQRVGQSYAAFVAELRDSPVPNEWKKTGPVPGTSSLTYDQLRAEYQAKREEASLPDLERAREAFRTCAAYAAKYAIDDETARACADWLAKDKG